MKDEPKIYHPGDTRKGVAKIEAGNHIYIGKHHERFRWECKRDCWVEYTETLNSFGEWERVTHFDTAKPIPSRWMRFKAWLLLIPPTWLTRPRTKPVAPSLPPARVVEDR